VAENTGKNVSVPISIQPDPPTVEEELASAKILFQEGLIEEAKKILHKILMVHAGHRQTQDLLKEIHDVEIGLLLRANPDPGNRRKAKTEAFEDPEEVIRRLEKDLGVRIDPSLRGFDASVENWNHPEVHDPMQAFDLGVAFFEMGCYRDAIRQLSGSVRRTRVTQATLGEQGVAAAALCAESMIALGEAYEAAAWLTPMLNELDLSHEKKVPFFYLMGRAEELLNHRAEAKAWYRKVLEVDPLYRDAPFRIRIT
jgi:tetratricopeptide (TPR) repeat protein